MARTQGKTKQGSATPRTGRRAGNSTSHRDILSAATTLFAEHGFAGASMRSIASVAQVDPALIRHFFGNKEGLFTAVIESQTENSIDGELLSDRAPLSTGGKLIRRYLQLWNSPQLQPLLLALLRSAVTNNPTRPAAQLLHIVSDKVITPTTPHLSPSAHIPIHTQLLGLATARYLLVLPQLTDLSNEQLVAMYAPALDALLGDYMQDVNSGDGADEVGPGLTEEHETSAHANSVSEAYDAGETSGTSTDISEHPRQDAPPKHTPPADNSPAEELESLLLTEELPLPETPEIPHAENQKVAPATYARPAVEGAHEPTLFGEEPSPAKPRTRKKAVEQQPSLFDGLF